MSAFGFADRLVEKTSAILDRRMTRRSVISKATILGSAVAAAGCVPITQQGSPFTFITDCGGGLCRDGYTEFCCVINSGQNSCPPNSIPSGWWRADYSVYCNGTRYYIDCNDYTGGGPCRCAVNCDTRKVYCNHFRYGQCNTDIPGTGVIACRVVTCTPPYLIPGANCVNSGAVDNSTAGHFTDCTPYTPAPPPPPPPPPKPTSPPAVAVPLGGAASPAPGEVMVLTRTGDGAVAAQHLAGGVWQGWQALPLPSGTAGSRVVAVSPAPGIIDALVVGSDRQLWWQHWESGAWAPAWQPLGGSSLSSDPAALAVDGVVHVAVRNGAKATLLRRLSGGSWSGFEDLGGVASSDPALAKMGSQLMLTVRGFDAAMYAKRNKGSWPGGWTDLDGIITSDASVVGDSSGYWVFGRGTDNAVYAKRSSSTAWQSAWLRLKGMGATSDPVAVFDGSVVRVFIRGSGNHLYSNRRVSGAWTGWQDLGSPAAGLSSDPLVLAAGGEVSVFAKAGNEVAVRRQTGGVWGAWETLAGVTVAPVRGATSA